jgi:hypothetical protein
VNTDAVDMTEQVRPDAVSALRRAAVRATLAPSVHNTQPWRFVLGPDTLEIHADRLRQLSVLDPAARQLVISCGCALFNIRVALASQGYLIDVARFPDPIRSNLLARVTVMGRTAEADPIAALDAVLELRRSNRRQFAEDPVPSELVADLRSAATAEASVLFPIKKREHLLITASLSQQADRAQQADPGYRAELRRWTTDNVRRLDGVPTAAIPHVDGRSEDDIPIRDFDTYGAGALPAATHSSLRQCLLLLGTTSDSAWGWLRAGEALERVLLEVTRHGFASSLLTQVVEVPRTRALLRQELGLAMNPHILLRVGRAPTTPATRRRRLVDVLSETPRPRELSTHPLNN